MSAAPPFRSAREIVVIGEEVASHTLFAEDARTLPVPAKGPEDRTLLMMYYPERGPPGNRTVSPPRFAVFIDGRTGAVSRSGKVDAAQLGIMRSDEIVAGVGIPVGIPVEVFWKKDERLLEISAEVWKAYAGKLTSSDPRSRNLASEYWALFAETTDRRVAPFYLQAAPTFFGWLRKTAAGEP